VNEVNSKIVWAAIRNAGDALEGRLPDSNRHPKGRNPYAHVSLEIKNKFGCSYKDIPDDKISELKDYIEYLLKNPS